MPLFSNWNRRDEDRRNKDEEFTPGMNEIYVFECPRCRHTFTDEGSQTHWCYQCGDPEGVHMVKYPAK
jgi:rRNA maturation endonuclease Nob1